MDLANFEMEAGTSTPLSGAVVQAFVSSLTHPNLGSVVASTSSNLSGYWTLTGLSDAQTYDIKVTYGGKSKWYKAGTRHNIAHMYDDTTPDANRNLLHNGGQDSWIERGTGAITLPAVAPGIPNTADGWESFLGSGDSGTAQFEATIVAPNSKGSTKFSYNRSGGQATHQRAIPDIVWQMLKGQTISESFQVFQDTISSELRAFIDDGVSITYGTVTSVVGLWRTITVVKTISASATKVVCGTQTNRVDTGVRNFYVDNGIADTTSIPPVFAPDVNDAILIPVISRSTIVEAAPTVDSNTLAVLLNNLAERSKSIMGVSGGNWKSVVPRTLTQLVADIAAVAANLTSGLALKLNLTGGSMSGLLSITINSPASGNSKILELINQTAVGNTGVYIRLVAGSGETLIGLFTGNSILQVIDATTGLTALDIRIDGHLYIYGQRLIDATNIGAQTVAAAGSATTAVNADNVTSTIGTVAISGYTRRNAGSYVGNNTGQAINVGFQARHVLITSNEPANYTLIGISTNGNKVASGVFSAQSGVHIDSGNTFSVGAPAEANNSGNTYQWVAYS